ncbi:MULTISPECIES: CaiB/BaiF CoA-transferase family protein [Achromobacter]|uniref:CaiB/BaiF CoA transferase family protein n=1 Tax=Achromobacter TaxID=222 RepID=UPI0007514791|nr:MULTISPECIES: CaiB/BaiF CoA-transferase family protein [Achromobacter]MDH1300748.1 CoA transferase [Achromobacter sp. GD03932]WLW62147.1 CaiB/BaiF CoA-transferase family protein [Achromobacter aegrifaciens]
MSNREPPLSGITVLDMTRIMAGPWCTQNLADLGAEVLKIERPLSGDDTRGWGPPNLMDAEGRRTQESAYYLAANRNKKSLALDIATQAGAEAVSRLAAGCDIFVENFKVGGLRKYGLDYASLRELNPRLIYCSITGFGQDGPYAEKPGYDFVIQALGGLMSITGEKDALPGGGPQKAGNAAADLMAGMYATSAILAALHERSRSGLGQHIDISMLDCQVAALGVQNFNYFLSGEVPRREGNAHVNLAPYQVFEAADGHVVLGVGNDGQFQKFCAAAGRPDLAGDERYLTNTGRVLAKGTLIPELERLFRTRGRDEWVGLLDAAGVPVGVINDIAQVHENPQVRARGLKFSLPHPVCGSVPQVRSPMRFSESPVAYRNAAPLLGADTQSVLSARLGCSETEIAALQQPASLGEPR